MRRICGLLPVVCAWCALTLAGQDPETARAQGDIEKLRELVAAGAAPRLQLERAEAALADVRDAAFLRRTLYGAELTEDQAGEMVAAAQRRLDRRRADLAAARRLVDEGVASQLSLGPYLQELDRQRKECDAAESRARLVRELARMVRIEEEIHANPGPAIGSGVAERYDGSGFFSMAEFYVLEASFLGRFAKPLPVSALGQTAVHRALGFDHRDRVDVAVHPDQPEGVWLRAWLEQHRIPYFAFRQAVRGKATGAHIHIGPVSTRIARTEAAAAGGS